MTEKLEIKIKEGLNELKFGISMDDVKKLLGTPDDTEIIEEDDENTEVWYYWEDGLTVFFEESEDKRCVCLETDNPDAVLLGKKISKIKEKEIEEMFKKENFIDFEEENENWGEKRISVNDAVLDIYFEKGDLVSVNWGVDYNEEGEVIWPK